MLNKITLPSQMCYCYSKFLFALQSTPLAEHAKGTPKGFQLDQTSDKTGPRLVFIAENVHGFLTMKQQLKFFSLFPSFPLVFPTFPCLASRQALVHEPFAPLEGKLRAGVKSCVHTCSTFCLLKSPCKASTFFFFLFPFS